jgi:hypothetical protein
MEITAAQRLVLLSSLACILIALALAILYRLRVSSAERERRRRMKLNLLGRLGDALITDVSEEALYYSYNVRGVSYHASQDTSTLGNYLPVRGDRLIGPAYIKYLPRNPANSIIICEQWSGLRALRAARDPALPEQSGSASAPAAG